MKIREESGGVLDQYLDQEEKEEAAKMSSIDNANIYCTLGPDLIKQPAYDKVSQSQYSTSTVSKALFSKDKFNEYVKVEQSHGLDFTDFAIFGDRQLTGYIKIRLLSKVQNTVYWLFKKEIIGKDAEIEGYEDEYFIIQQIPRDLPNFEKQIGNVNSTQSPLFRNLISKQGMRNMVFEISEVIDEAINLDIWVVYFSEAGLDQSYSLKSLLWNIDFDPSKVIKNYEIEHGGFYKMLLEEDGNVHLAVIINTICELLKVIADIGAMYGNLRCENIIIKLDKGMKSIISVKFLSFGTLTNIEDADKISLPDQIEHLPPDMTSWLVKIQRFAANNNIATANGESSNDGQSDQNMQAPLHENKQVNVKFLQASASADVFALGVVLLQIATGYPCQNKLPIKMRCKTVEDKQYLVQPYFGCCLEGMIDQKNAAQTIKLQERILNNLRFFMKRSADHYGLLKDKHFKEILTQLLAAKHYNRPNISEIKSSHFIMKWTEKVGKQVKK